MSLRDVIAAQYGNPRGLLGHAVGWFISNRPSNRARMRWTLDLLDLWPGHRVLEIGCGAGGALAACARVVTDGRLVGIDHSPVMIAQARRRIARAAGVDRIALRHGGLEALGAAGPFDRVYSINVVQFLPDLDAAYRDIHAVTAPGGLVATTYLPRKKNVTRDDALRMAGRVATAMDRVGFTGVATDELPLSPAPAICVRGRRGAD